MGVKHLWDIIDEVKTKESLDFLRGKIVSVDLSIWIVEASKTLQFKTSIIKPHLRNIFYRILALRKLGIKLLFVTEGEAPDLKQDTMKKRNEARYGLKSKTKGRVGRSRFQNTIKECCQLLDLLGMPYIKAAGEAEAMCAILDSEGYSDGCLTNDGDFFLYGGQTIFRDFGIDPKDPHVYVYNTADIKRRINLMQNDMIGLALLAGCDYTNGVVGVGKGLIKTFLEERSFSDDLLSRFKQWQKQDFLVSKDLVKSEIMIARKAIKSEGFLNQEIIDEYLICKDHLHQVKDKLRWGYPNIRGLQEFLNEKMEWPFDYTLSKIMQLASSTYLEKLNCNTFYPVVISPSHIVKNRCQYGVALVEIKWEKDDSQIYNVDMRWDNCPESFTTVENHQAVLQSLPGLVEKFAQQKAFKKSVKPQKKEKKSEKEVNGIKENHNSQSKKVSLSNDTRKKDKNDLCVSFLKESQESPGYVLQKTKLSGDFFDDVLCDDMKTMSIELDKENDEKTNIIDLELENILPLHERLMKTKMRRNAIKNGETPTKNDFSVVKKDSENKETQRLSVLMKNRNKHIETHKTNFSLKQDLSILLNDSNFKNLSPLFSSDNFEHFMSQDDHNQCSTPHVHKESSTKSVKKSFIERTPCCLQFETPSLESETTGILSSKGLSISNPFHENEEPSLERGPQMKDITTFSNLGDSILGHSLELFETDNPHNQSCNPRKSYGSAPIKNLKSVLYDSLDLCDNRSLISNHLSLGDSILCESLDLEISSKLQKVTVNLNDNERVENRSNFELSENYEDLLRERFQISLHVNSVNETNSFNVSTSFLASEINDISVTEGSPLCLSERLKGRLTH